MAEPDPDRKEREAEVEEVEALLNGLIGADPAGSADPESPPAPAAPTPPESAGVAPAAPTPAPSRPRPGTSDPASMSEQELKTWERTLGSTVAGVPTNLIDGPIPGLAQSLPKIEDLRPVPAAPPSPESEPDAKPGDALVPIDAADSVAAVPRLPAEALDEVREVSAAGTLNPFAVSAHATPPALRFETDSGDSWVEAGAFVEPRPDIQIAFEPDDPALQEPRWPAPGEGALVPTPPASTPAREPKTIEASPFDVAAESEPAEPEPERSSVADRMAAWLASKTVASAVSGPAADTPASGPTPSGSPAKPGKIDWLAKARKKKSGGKDDAPPPSGPAGGTDAGPSEPASSSQPFSPAQMAAEKPSSGAPARDAAWPDQVRTQRTSAREVEPDTADASGLEWIDRDKAPAGAVDRMAALTTSEPVTSDTIEPDTIEPDTRGTAESLRAVPSPLENLEASLYFEPPQLGSDFNRGLNDSGILRAVGGGMGAAEAAPSEIEHLIRQRVQRARSSAHLHVVEVGAGEPARGLPFRFFGNLLFGRGQPDSRGPGGRLWILLFASAFALLLALSGSWWTALAGGGLSLLVGLVGASWRTLASLQGLTLISLALADVIQYWDYFFPQ